MKINKVLKILKIIGVIPLIFVLILLVYSIFFDGIVHQIKSQYDETYLQEIYFKDENEFELAVNWISENEITMVDHQQIMDDERKNILKGTLYYEFEHGIKNISENNPVNKLFDVYDFDIVIKNDNGDILFLYPNVCLVYSSGEHRKEWNEISDNWYWTDIF